MNKAEINKLVRRQEHIVTILTDDQDEFLDMLEEFYEISTKLNNTKTDKLLNEAIEIITTLEEYPLTEKDREWIEGFMKSVKEKKWIKKN